MSWRRPRDKPLSEPMMVKLPTHICVNRFQWVNTLRPRQNGRCFADDILKSNFFYENCCIMIQNSLKCSRGSNEQPTLVQIMALRQTGEKPLYELMMAQFTDTHRHTHIYIYIYAIYTCVTRTRRAERTSLNILIPLNIFKRTEMLEMRWNMSSGKNRLLKGTYVDFMWYLF